MRAHREIVTQTFARERLLRDVAVTTATHALLQPLLEGLSLFTEFDAAPGNSDVFATPEFWAGFMFQPLDSEPPVKPDAVQAREWFTDCVYSVLGAYRSSDEAILRKTSVLMQSFDQDPQGYLVGYMAVKQIWINAAAQTRAFLDRDLFLAFLRDWIFQDWELIDYLLNEDLGPEAAAYFLVERIQQRLVALATEDLSSEAESFNRQVGAGVSDPESMFKALRLSSDDCRSGQRRLAALTDGLREGISDDERGVWFAVDAATLLHRQQIVRLATEEVEIEVNDHRRAIVRRDESLASVYMAGPAPSDAEPGITRGWLAVCYLPDYHQMVALAVREKQPIIWIAPPSIPDDDWRSLRQIVTSVIVTESMRAEITTYCKETALGLDDAQYNSVVERIPGLAQRIYANYALAAPEDRVPALNFMLSRKGLYDLLHKDGDLLTALVRMSLVPTLNADTRKQIQIDLQEEGIDLDRAIDELKAIQEETGMTLLLTAATGAMWCTV
jgi:hypothetical protein